MIDPNNNARFVGNDIYRVTGFGKHHPLAFPRMATLMSLCELLGWLDEQNFAVSPEADIDLLTRFHDADYVSAFKTADASGQVDQEVRKRYRIGTMENPLFPNVFQRAATAVGGSVLAAELALQGYLAFHPSGGTHHGKPDQASGFCYFNDPVFALLGLLDGGIERIFYADLDAHHGDGVQNAFATDPRVFTLSIHEQRRWPHSGALDDRAGGAARNLPVPKGFNDSELDFLMTEAVLPLAREFEPQAVVITCGADGLAGDPLSRLALSNVSLWRAVQQLVQLTGHNVVLGGGGYNPWTTARCWAGLWGILSGRELPDVMPVEAQSLLRKLECDLVDEEDVEPFWLTRLADPVAPGEIRESVKSAARAVRH